MPDISAFASAFSSLKAAKDIAEAMVSLRDAQAFQSKLIEFQSKLIDANSAALAAQDERVALLERVDALEKEVARLKLWETEKGRYELKEIESGAVAYVPKESMRGTEPMHWVCAQCYQNNKKGFLQSHHGDVSFTYYKCQECGGEIRIRKPRSQRPVGETPRYNPFARRY